MTLNDGRISQVIFQWKKSERRIVHVAYDVHNREYTCTWPLQVSSGTANEFRKKTGKDPGSWKRNPAAVKLDICRPSNEGEELTYTLYNTNSVNIHMRTQNVNWHYSSVVFKKWLMDFWGPLKLMCFLLKWLKLGGFEKLSFS